MTSRIDLRVYQSERIGLDGLWEWARRAPLLVSMSDVVRLERRDAARTECEGEDACCMYPAAACRLRALALGGIAWAP
jgi:hypothetical protein